MRRMTQNSAGDLPATLRRKALVSIAQRAGLDTDAPAVVAVIDALSTDEGTKILLAIVAEKRKGGARYEM